MTFPSLLAKLPVDTKLLGLDQLLCFSWQLLNIPAVLIPIQILQRKALRRVYTVYFLKPCMATGFGVSLVLKAPFHTSHRPSRRKTFSTHSAYVSQQLIIPVCWFPKYCPLQPAQLGSGQIGSLCESLHLYEKLSLFYCRHQSCSALPFQAIHRVWKGRAMAEHKLIHHCHG